MTHRVHMARPRDRGWLEPLTARLGLEPCGCERGSPVASPPGVRPTMSFPGVLITTGGECPLTAAAAAVIHVGRRPPGVADRHVDLWCVEWSEEAEAIREAGIEAEIRVTGHPDVERLCATPRWPKRRPTAYLAVSDRWLARLRPALVALQQSLPDLDVIVDVDVEPVVPRLEAWKHWSTRLDVGKTVIPLPPGLGDRLPTLAQADLLIADAPEYVEPFAVLERPIVLWGVDAERWRSRYAAITLEAADPDPESLAAAIMTALARPPKRRVAAPQRVPRTTDDEVASAGIAALVEGWIARAV